MTKDDLESQANGLIASAKASVLLQGSFPFTILVHFSGEWMNLPFPKELEPLLNVGKAKDLIYTSVRETVQARKADGVIFGSEAWFSRTTPEGLPHYDSPEWKELHDFGFVKLVQRGWVKRYEAFVITAQSATDALVIRQTFQRLESGAIQLLDCERRWFEQDHFGGRQKMFGDLRWENLGSEEAVKGTANK